jgi:hypothetical protein
MGGSSGGGGGRYVAPSQRQTGGNGSGHDTCDLSFQAVLVNVDRNAASEVAPKQNLPLRLENRQTVDVVVATTIDGSKIVGSVNAPQTLQLISCMRADHTYSAEVQKVSGHVITVLVRRN